MMNNVRRPSCLGQTTCTVGLLAIGFLLLQPDRADAQQWTTHSNGVDIYTTNPAAKAGIGTTGPNRLLHIRDTANGVFTGARVSVPFDGSDPVYELLHETANKGFRWRLGNGISSDLYLDYTTTGFTSYTPYLTVLNSGNVGIGTLAPGARLHVYEAPLNAAVDKAGSYFYLESNNDTGATINNTHSVISVEGSTGSGFGWAGQIGVKAVVGPYWGPITDARSFYAQAKTRLNYHSITNYSGFYVDTPTVVTNSSITNAYGLYVGLQKGTNVTNGYGVYQAGAADINYFAGNVGVGTTTPGARLEVAGKILSSGGLAENSFLDRTSIRQWTWYGTGDVARFFANGVGDLLFITSSGSLGIGATPSVGNKLHVAGSAKVTGDMTVDGNIAAKYQDVAEWVPASRAIAAGTVVVLDADQSNHVLPSTRSYDTRVAGVVSEKPGVILGEAGEGKVMVATTGRVRVKVDASLAPIRVGDLLVTSDKEGIAMRSEPLDLGGTPIHRPGTLIGKALEPLEKGIGEILVLLSLQ